MSNVLPTLMTNLSLKTTESTNLKVGKCKISRGYNLWIV